MGTKKKLILDPATIADQMDEIHSQLLDYEVSPKHGMVINGQARYVSWDFTKMDFDQLELLHITDVQFGQKECDKERFHEYLAWVLAEPNRYIFLGGDLVDAGHKLSKGSPHEQIGDPQTEVFEFCRIMAPLRHRVLGYVGGNHERRGMDTFGDLGRTIATLLKIPYSPGKQHIDIYFGDHKPFRTSLYHGNGSGQTKGAIANMLYRQMLQADSQLYLTGHLHQSIIIPESREFRCIKNREMKTEKTIGGVSSTFLKHYGTYGEVAGYRAGLLMMCLAILDKNGHWGLSLK
jgi:hypothetical protein